MQLPPSPSSSSSASASSTTASSPFDGGYLGIPAMSSRLKALEQKILRQIGPIDPGAANRNTSRNITVQARQIPSETHGHGISSPTRCFLSFQLVSIVRRPRVPVRHHHRARLLFNCPCHPCSPWSLTRGKNHRSYVRIASNSVRRLPVKTPKRNIKRC